MSIGYLSSILVCMLLAAAHASPLKVYSRTAPALRLAMSASSPAHHRLEGAEWTDMNLTPSQLRPHLTLKMGQSFAWKVLYDGDVDKVWVGVVGEFPVAIKETPTATYYCDLRSQDTGNAALRATLHSYFQVDADYNELYEQWAGGCDRMKAVTQALRGVRVLRQDPWETLVSFICSSNNNIKVCLLFHHFFLLMIV